MSPAQVRSVSPLKPRWQCSSRQGHMTHNTYDQVLREPVTPSSPLGQDSASSRHAFPNAPSASHHCYSHQLPRLCLLPPPSRAPSLSGFSPIRLLPNVFVLPHSVHGRPTTCADGSGSRPTPPARLRPVAHQPALRLPRRKRHHAPPAAYHATAWPVPPRPRGNNKTSTADTGSEPDGGPISPKTTR